MNDKKITWINGMKGLACLVVFCHHFFLSFYRGVYFGDAVESVTASGIDVKLGYEPYGVILNGNFAVCVFIMISAFLFARKTMIANAAGKKINYLNEVVKRYLRLMPAVAVVGILNYVLIKVLDMYDMNYIHIKTELSPLQLLIHTFISLWVRVDSSVLGPLWCMKELFVGAFIALFLGEMSRKERWYMPIIYCPVTVLLTFIDPYYLTVGIGVILADLSCNDRVSQWKLGALNKKWICITAGVLFIVFGLFLGGYPSAATPVNPVYVIMSKAGDAAPIGFHSVGAFFLLAGCNILPKTYILSSKVFGVLGDLSFSIFLVHSTIINFLAYYTKDTIQASTGTLGSAVWLAFAIIFPLVLLLAFIYNRLVEKNVGKLVNKISFK